MIKNFCDICGEEVLGSHKGVYINFSDKVLSDKTAMISAELKFKFVKHSKGVVSPPDLCSSCVSKFIGEILSQQQASADKNKQKNNED